MLPIAVLGHSDVSINSDIVEQVCSKLVKTKDSFAVLALLPCVVSFAAAASACEKAAQWQFALELLEEAKQAKSQARIDVNLLQ